MSEREAEREPRPRAPTKALKTWAKRQHFGSPNVIHEMLYSIIHNLVIAQTGCISFSIALIKYQTAASTYYPQHQLIARATHLNG